MYRGITFFSLTVLLLGIMSWQPQSSFTSTGTQPNESSAMETKEAGNAHRNSKDPGAQPYTCQGTGTFTHGVLDCTGSTYYYNVTGGPPNSCGELHIVRNGNAEVTPCWLTTDGYGNATKGPWTVSTDQTGQSIYIKWPDGSQTCGGDTQKIDDLTRPAISIDQSGGSGVPNAFSGSASDTMYGSGFGWWTNMPVVFVDITTGLSWDGSCYCSNTPVTFYATFSPSGGYSVNWSITPTPDDHTSGHKYRWVVQINDQCGYTSRSILFQAP